MVLCIFLRIAETLGRLIPANLMICNFIFHLSFAPLLILALPIFDTIYVSIVRLSKKMSPLHGSPDHVALRLFRRGLSKKQVLLCLFLGAVNCLKFN